MNIKVENAQLSDINTQYECSTLKHLQWTLGVDWSLLSGGKNLQQGWLERATNWREGRVDTPIWKTAMANVSSPGWESLQNSHREQGLNHKFRLGQAFCRDRKYGSYPDLEQQTIRKLNADAGDDIHPLAIAIRGFLDIIHIHPFNDGNARAACTWLVWSLVSRGYDVPDMKAIMSLPQPPANNRIPKLMCLLLS